MRVCIPTSTPAAEWLCLKRPLEVAHVHHDYLRRNDTHLSVRGRATLAAHLSPEYHVMHALFELNATAAPSPARAITLAAGGDAHRGNRTAGAPGASRRVPTGPLDALSLPLAAGDIKPTLGNPFFDTAGEILHTPLPDALMTALRDAGCSRAWRRYQHQESDLDRACDAIVRPFLRSHPGSLVGLSVALNVGVGAQRSFFVEDHIGLAMYTDASLMVDDETGQAVPDFSQLPWWQPGLGVPPMMRPRQNLRGHQRVSKREALEACSSTAPFGAGYGNHHFGKLAFELAFEAAKAGARDGTDDEAAGMTAAVHATELFQRFAHHRKQGQPIEFCPPHHNCSIGDARHIRDPLWIHSVHGVTWTLLQMLMKSADGRFRQPTTAVWDMIRVQCAQVRARNRTQHEIVDGQHTPVEGTGP